ncbi:MAG: hypothetical protein ACREJQ_00745, partial [bacterium]
LMKLGFAGMVFGTGEFLTSFPLMALGVVALAACVVVGLVMCLRSLGAGETGSGSLPSSLLLAMVIGIGITAVGLTFPVGIGTEFFPARILFIYPAVVYFAGWAIAMMVERLPPVGAVLLFILLGAFAMADISYYMNANPISSTYSTPWRQYAKDLIERSADDDWIICDEPALLYYVAGKRMVIVFNRADQEDALQENLRSDLPGHVFILWNPKDVTGGAYSRFFDYLSLAYKLEYQEAFVKDTPIVMSMKRRFLPDSPEVKRELREYRLETLAPSMLPPAPPSQEEEPDATPPDVVLPPPLP